MEKYINKWITHSRSTQPVFLIAISSTGHLLTISEKSKYINILPPHCNYKWTEIDKPKLDVNLKLYPWTSKPMCQLIGKYAIRDKPLLLNNAALEDYSFTDNAIYISKINSSGTITVHSSLHPCLFDLKKEWNDGNWYEVPWYIYEQKIL